MATVSTNGRSPSRSPAVLKFPARSPKSAALRASLRAEDVAHLAGRFSDFSWQLKRYAESMNGDAVESDLLLLMIQVRESVNSLPEVEGGAL